MSGKTNKIGRPPSQDPKMEKRFVYLTPEDWAKIDKLANASSIASSTQARMILHRALAQLQDA